MASTTYLIQTSDQLELKSGSNCLIDTLHLTNPLGLGHGGLGAAYADQDAMKSDFGLAVGSDIQAYSAALAQIAGLNPSDGQIISYNNGSSAWVAADPAVPNVYTADGSTLALNAGEFSVADAGIGSTQLADGAVASAKIADGAVASAKLADSAVATAKIADNAVATAKIANGAISEAKINDGAVSAAKLAATSVSAAKLGSDVAGSGLTGGNGAALEIDDAVVAVLGNDNTFTGDVTVNGNVTINTNFTLQKTGQSAFISQLQYEAQSVDGTSFNLASIALEANAASMVVADVVLCSDDMADYAAFRLSGVFVNDGSTPASQNLNQQILYRSNAGFDAALILSSSNAVVSCTGAASKNLRWHADVKAFAVPKYAA